MTSYPKLPYVLAMRLQTKPVYLQLNLKLFYKYVTPACALNIYLPSIVSRTAFRFAFAALAMV